jgi:uncharacterized protein (DUF952 family)
MIIYHITTEQEWNQANLDGFYEAPSLHSEGFIHCSTEQQVEGVLQRYFDGKTNLIKLVINTEKLNSELKFEMSATINEEFAHVYGTINLDAVVGVMAVNQSSERTSK